MSIKDEYIEEAVKSIINMDSSLNEDKVRKIVTRKVKENLQDPTIIVDNNVTGDNARISLTKLAGWITKRGPVISGNATFYMQPKELLSPTSNMLRSLKKGRKAVKNQMFKHKPSSDEYQSLDLDQGNKKVIMNADYGGSGTPTAAFYTKYSPAATTLMAQSIITTMAAFFEGYVGDNQKFFHINECYDWMNKVIEKKDKVHKWVFIPTPKQVLDRIISHFIEIGPNDYKFLKRYIFNRSNDELVYLYYANNLKGFILNNREVSKLIYEVLNTLPVYEAAEKELPTGFENKFTDDEFNTAIDNYNKWLSDVMFLNPYKIPGDISHVLNEFINLLTQYVYVEYITPDSIIKLNNHKRNTVLLVDTDSNIINSDIFVSFILDVIFPNEHFGRKRMYNEMILVNVLAAALDRSVKNMLDYYGRMHNMDEESRAELTMKNEFMFRRLFLMKTKKRYGASIVLREGNIMVPFKLEIKGLDFIKAGVTDEVTKRFTKMLKDHILFSDELELHELMKDLKKFENEIYHNLKAGNTDYLKIQNYKAESAYKQIKDSNGRVIGSKAWSLPVFRGAAVWNELYPSQKIYSLDRVKIIKLTVTKMEDLERIKDIYPEEYNMVISKIYHSEKQEIQNCGFKVIAIPNNIRKIPDWILPLIDYDIIISDVISSFRSVLDALNIEEMYFKTPNGDANITSCLISI